ncbi:MAG: potassium transporter Kup [Chthoniobacterales bacterium]|nr:potassium transporter Kup [Chthoniobacterales bacterium]
MDKDTGAASPRSKKLALTLAALGVVFGDIGTSPLYAFKESIAHSVHSGTGGAEAVLGILSLILWSLIVLVSIKYVGLILRADNHGEGGILALLNLAFPAKDAGSRQKGMVIMTAVGLLGAALLYGDGVITPAISVLSAVEGLKLFAPGLAHLILPIAVGILIGLFSIQQFGTGAIGKFFGPIILIWFFSIGFLGLLQVVKFPGVIAAINPLAGLGFLVHHPAISFVILGSVFLSVTGGEALYADMGHFGRIPIRTAWRFVVLPSLALNYLGQGALVLANPAAAENPFYLLAPGWATLPLVILATMATVIASQALISGVFSLTTSAIQMGYLPRIQIFHTNYEKSGQIYIPAINTALAAACITLVIVFKSSSALAAAYGIAVTLTMLATTLLFYCVARRNWGWSLPHALGVCLIFAFIEILFLSSNLLKLLHGGWITVVIGGAIFYLMTTWKIGRTFVREKSANALSLPDFIESISMSGVLNPAFAPHRVSGTAVFLSASPNVTPGALTYNLTHNHVLHERNIVLTITLEKIPYVAESERVEVRNLSEGFLQVFAKFGFMEVPTIKKIVAGLKAKDIELHPDKCTFFLGRETLIKSQVGLSPLRARVFIAMARNAQNAAQFFRLPSNRTVEIGKQFDI